MTIFLPAFSVSLGALADQKGRGRFDSLRRVGFASVIESARLHGPPALQTNKAATNGRLLRWPPFAKGSLSGSWDRIAALLAYGGHYRALAGGAIIPGDRPVRPDFEKPPVRCVQVNS